MTAYKNIFQDGPKGCGLNTVVHLLIIVWGSLITLGLTIFLCLFLLVLKDYHLSLWHYLVILICKNFLKKVDIWIKAPHNGS